MSDDNRPNYFLLLELDLNARWDMTEFTKRLKIKRGEWSRVSGQSVGKKKTDAQLALEYLDKITPVMTDPGLREQERADARAKLADARVRQRSEFGRDLNIMLSKGFLWDADVRALRLTYPEVTRDPELADKLDHLPTRAINEQHVIPAQLDPSTAKGIQLGLDTLGEKSLYTVLATEVDPGISERSPLDRLSAAANSLYDLANKNPNKGVRQEAKQSLGGHAMHVFETDHARSRYDNTIALAPVVELIEKYRLATATVKRLEAGQVERFLADAAAVGATTEVALAMLLKQFEMLKWTMQLPASVVELTHEDQVRCEGCESWNDTENEFCVVCGTRLRIICPRCDRTVSGHGACGGCGFPVGDFDWVTLLLRDCTELVDREDLAGAERKLAEAERAWPSEGDDELAVRLKECRRLVASLRAKRATEDEHAAQKLRVLAEQRNYQALLRRAISAPATVPDRDRIIQQSEEHIREADRLCALAERTTMPERLEHYAEALAHCADHTRARAALNALPPTPPRDLRTESAGHEVRLAWTPSNTDNVRYVVVRKSGAAPASVTDGSRLATGRWTSYTDRAPETGASLHYAVFAQRPTGVASEHAATTTEPVFLPGQVAITSRRVDDGVVELAWQLPIHATGVLVQRTTTGRTTHVVAAEPTMLRDEGLVNGVSHTYTLRASYPDVPASADRSAGVSVSLVPGPPPVPTGPVVVRTVTRNLGLSYRLVDLLPHGAAPGTADVWWTQHRPPIRPGEQYPITELTKHGTLLAEAAAQSFALRRGRYYFAHVAIQHGIGYVGDIRRYAARDEVGELDARNLGDHIRLTWAWPDEVSAALVTYDHDDWPADPTLAAHRQLIERVGNDRTGWYDIAGSTATRGQDFHFVVAAAEISDDEVFVATGVRCAAHLSPQRTGLRRRRGR